LPPAQERAASTVRGDEALKTRKSQAKERPESSEQTLITKAQERCLYALLLSKKRLKEEGAQHWMLETCSVDSVKQISRSEASYLIQKLNKL